MRKPGTPDERRVAALVLSEFRAQRESARRVAARYKTAGVDFAPIYTTAARNMRFALSLEGIGTWHEKDN